MFTRLDGSIVAAGDLVASVKVAPHVVEGVRRRRRRADRRRRPPAARPGRAVPADAGRGDRQGVAPGADRPRFETSVRDKVESLGSTIVAIDYVADEEARRPGGACRRARGRGRADVILTAGGRSTDPSDPFFVAIDALGGRVVRHGVPAHPGSMLWLARIGRTAILGLPTCGAYSKATAADLLLPRLLTGEPPTLPDGVAPWPRRRAHPRDAVPVPAVRPRARGAGRLTEWPEPAG